MSLSLPIPEPNGPLDESALVERIRSGDESAFDVLFTVYYERLCAFAERYVRAKAPAEDIVIDVLHKCWENRTTWVVRGTVRSYLYRAVANAASNEVRNLNLRARLLHSSAAGSDVPPGMASAPTLRGVGDPACARDLARAIDAAVAALPPRCRAVFVLKWQHGLSYQEIAHTLGISVKTVEMQMSRAARALRPQLAAYR